MNCEWKDKLLSALPSQSVFIDERSLEKYSKDYYYFSPVLLRELEACLAECIVRPQTEAELDTVLSICAAYAVPITVRGSGTGNYGQAIPLSGGVVLDMSAMNQVLRLEGDLITVQSGIRMGKMEQFSRQHGFELRVYPSTFQKATIGGFISGGSGGIGSITWGTIWDGLVHSIKVKTVEKVPRTLTIQGEALIPYIHNYGTAGIITELSIFLSPKNEWEQWAITFDEFSKALCFGMTLAEIPAITKRLLSIHEWPLPASFTPLHLPKDKAVCLLEIASSDSALIYELAEQWGGEIALQTPAEQYHRGVGVSDFTWNHTTLWAMKENPAVTYLQTRFSTDDCLTQIEKLKADFPELTMHIELMRNHGQLTVSGLPVFVFSTDEHLRRLIEACEAIGVSVANPHTWRLEFGGRSPELRKLIKLKQENDPQGLLNPHKLVYETRDAERVV